jgi:hypothetical protein
MDPMTPKLAAEKVREVARKYRETYPVKKYGTAISADCKDLRKIASLIRTGKYNEARLMIWGLDTLVREYIPQDVWVWLGCGS